MQLSDLKQNNLKPSFPSAADSISSAQYVRVASGYHKEYLELSHHGRECR